MIDATYKHRYCTLTLNLHLYDQWHLQTSLLQGIKLDLYQPTCQEPFTPYN